MAQSGAAHTVPGVPPAREALLIFDPPPEVLHFAAPGDKERRIKNTPGGVTTGGVGQVCETWQNWALWLVSSQAARSWMGWRYLLISVG